jgi:hypothetical protein
VATVYRHTQVGYTTIVSLGIALLGILYWAALMPRPALIAATVSLVVVLVLFSTLTVIIRDQTVEVFFGPGLIRRRIPLGRIRKVEAVRTPWYYGWGIRLTPHGWLWNVSGLGGVEMQFNDGKKFRIGSDEPERLVEVLRREKAF